MRETFVMYTSYDEKTMFLNDEEMGKLMRCIFKYEKEDDTTYKEKIIESLKDYPTVCTAFMFIADDLDRLNEKYKAKSKNGKLGGRPKEKEETEKKLSEDNEKLKKANESEHKPKESKAKANKTLYVNENVNVNDNDNVNENTSSEEEIKLVLDTGEYYSVTNEQIQGWQQSVPLVDVKSELRKMQLWLEGNPKKRKTAKGITRFITGWLVREQNSKEQNSKPITGVEDVPSWYGDTKQTEPTPEFLEEIEKMKESMRL